MFPNFSTKYVLILVLLPCFCSPFLVTHPGCHSSCLCSNNKVDCSNKGLKTFPSLVLQFPSNGTTLINLDGNSLTTIPGNAFRGVRVSTYSKLLLENNNIQNIHTDAFNGIESTVVHINLDNNSITSIPYALTKLPKLITLRILLNPISSFRASYTTLQALGGYLKIFYVDLQLFSSWALEINLLRSLEFLYITKFKDTQLFENVLYGLGDSLTMLTLRHTQLEKIPKAICDLRRLEHLKFEYNTNVDTSGSIVDPCPKYNSRIWFVELDYNNLVPSNIQNIFQAFPYLVILSISGNARLNDIPIQGISNETTLRNLHLKYDGFTKIPSSLSILKELRILEITHSKITSIRRHDLEGLTQLRTLALHDNPISQISGHAFQDKLLLNSLELQNTHLRTLPSFLKTLSSLGHLIMNRNIDCSCQLKYLQSWDIANIDIVGNCDSNRRIKDFLKYYLPKCG